jgi:type IV pilus assembly protein PilC
MKTFLYRAKGADGLEVRGSLKAIDEDDARATLEVRGFRIRSMMEASAEGATPKKEPPKKDEDEKPGRALKVFSYEVIGSDKLAVRGTLKAEDLDEARAQLEGRGLRIRTLREAEAAPSEAPAAAPEAALSEILEATPDGAPREILVPAPEQEERETRPLKLFSYQAAGPDGFAVRGSIRAPDLESARAQLEAKQMRIRNLTGAQDGPLKKGSEKLFTYQALSSEGMEFWGSVKADDVDDARAVLEGRGLRVRMLNEMAVSPDFAEISPDEGAPTLPAGGIPIRPPMILLAPSEEKTVGRLSIRPPSPKIQSRPEPSPEESDRTVGRLVIRPPVVGKISIPAPVTFAPPSVSPPAAPVEASDATIGRMEIVKAPPPEETDRIVGRIEIGKTPPLLRAPSSVVSEEPSRAEILPPAAPPKKPEEKKKRQFAYEVAGSDGLTMRGLIWAEDRMGAEAILESRGMRVLSLIAAAEADTLGTRPQPEKQAPAAAVPSRASAPAKKKSLQGALPDQIGRLLPFTRELVVSYREMAAMYHSGISIIRSMGLLSKQASHPRLREAFAVCREHIEKGGSLSYSMAQHPQIFNTLYVRLVEAGESSGNLGKMLDRIAEHSEKAQETALSIRSALSYPLFVFLLCMGLLIVGPAFTLKGIFEFLADLHVPLPLATRILIGASDILRSPITPVVFVVLAGTLVFLGCHFWSKPYFRKSVQAWLLRLPAVGEAIGAAEAENFARTLSMLYESGIPLLKAMELTEKSSGNVVLQETIAAARERILKGCKIQDAFKGSKLFPPMISSLLAVGEKSGKVGSMLDFAGMMFRQKLDSALELVAASMQPIVLLIVGALVGFVVIATLSPLLKVMEGLM